MCRNNIIRLLIIILIHEGRVFAWLMNESVCFIREQSSKKNDTWCPTELKLCGNTSLAFIISVNTQQFQNGNTRCEDACQTQQTASLVNQTSEIQIKCNGKSNCSLADISVPSTDHGGILTVTFVCNNTEICDNHACDDDDSATSTSKPTTEKNTTSTDNSTTSTENNSTSTESSTIATGNSTTRTENNTTSTESSTTSSDNSTPSTGSGATLIINRTEPTSSSVAQTHTDNPFTAAIVASVVIPAIITIVVVAVIMYRRGKCSQFVKGVNMYDKHCSGRSDAYAMSSRANANLVYDLSSGVDVNGCDVDYSEIDKFGKETDVQYSHVNLQKKQPVQDPTYNHIGHFNCSSGNAEHTYNHVGDETLRITESCTLQPDTYSHIGAMSKPVSEQLADDSYAHINGVMKYIPEAKDINQYECAVFETNSLPTGGYGQFYVVGPSKVDVNSEAPVSHSYFILEKHEKEA